MALARGRPIFWIAATGVVAVLALAAVTWLLPSDDFSYAVRGRPRVFASHAPLLPKPGQTLTIRVVPDIDADMEVTRANATLKHAGDVHDRECAGPVEGAYECTFELAHTDGDATYEARVVLSNGRLVRTRTEYLFSVRAIVDTSALIPVRVPRKRAEALPDSYRVDTVLGYDREGYQLAQFVDDARIALFDGILGDPAYRWRDDQLGFYIYARPAVVAGYYSGWDAACGQNPWPTLADLPDALAAVEVIGILHRRGSAGSEAEGSAAAGQTAFRDCAGTSVRKIGGSSRATFSASAGLPNSPSIAKHEFGHAAFGLGDEYYESEDTRRVDAATPVPGVTPQCCCRNASGSGGTFAGAPGGVFQAAAGLPGGTVECMRSNGKRTPELGASSVGLPVCDGFEPSPSCGIAPQAACPALSGTCVQQWMWLGVNPTAGAGVRPNVFKTWTECNDSAGLARDYPSVESPFATIGLCRKLCGGEGGPACPCGQEEAWIVDHNAAKKGSLNDAMSTAATARRLGGTCTWCVDTSLCVRWQRARGHSADQSWSMCRLPSPNAVLWSQFSEAVRALLEWVRQWLRLAGIQV